MKKSTVILLVVLVVVVVGLIWYSRTGPKATPIATGPQTPTTPAPKKVGEPPVTIECPNNSPQEGAGNYNDYRQVDCSTIAACQNPTGAAFDVDDYVQYGTDPDVCLKTTSDVAAWESPTRSYHIRVLSYASNGAHGNRAGHPFAQPHAGDGPPFGNGSQFRVTSGNRRSVTDHGAPGQRGQCYEFKAVLWVQRPTEGQPRCYDPHIYTTCDTDCTLVKP